MLAEFDAIAVYFEKISSSVGCCGRCSVDNTTCGLHVVNKLSDIAVNSTIFDEKFVPTIFPPVVRNRGHSHRFILNCGQYNEFALCSRCKDMQNDYESFIKNLSMIRDKRFIIELSRINITDMIHNRFMLQNYGLLFDKVIVNTLYMFCGTIFPSTGNHTKPARRDKIHS
jgi:hypothetical protein